LKESISGAIKQKMTWLFRMFLGKKGKKPLKTQKFFTLGELFHAVEHLHKK
jgi:hypothetical protein